MGVRDTSRDEPLLHLAGAMAKGSTDYIEGQEAQGQRELVASSQIPTECPVHDLQALGFKLGPVCESDPLFRECELPEGWQKEGTSHSMYSVIRDERGFGRVTIFYKAAFYDRRADAQVIQHPRTKAQEAVWKTLAEEIRYGSRGDRGEPWMPGDDRREGDNYVYRWRGRYGDNAPEGKLAYDDDGRRLEFEVAMDGSIVERREWLDLP
jgi:hypothetical protein